MKEEKIIEEYRGYLSLYHSNIIGDDGTNTLCSEQLSQQTNSSSITGKI